MKQAFLTTLLWSSSDDNGEPLDRKYSIDNIDNTDMIDHLIVQFIAAVESDPILISIENITDTTGNDSDRIAHDLCLTINGHGAGFWDGDYSDDGIGSGEYGDRLTAISKNFHEVSLYENNRSHLLISTH